VQRFVAIAVAVAVAFVFGVTASADAACPNLITWRQHTYLLHRTDGWTPHRPRNVPLLAGRVVARTAALSMECVPVPGWRPRKVNVYSLPAISPSVAIRIEGPTFKWAIYVRRGWAVRRGTPLWALTHPR
jgi:hypothetical protein